RCGLAHRSSSRHWRLVSTSPFPASKARAWRIEASATHPADDLAWGAYARCVEAPGAEYVACLTRYLLLGACLWAGSRFALDTGRSAGVLPNVGYPTSSRLGGAIVKETFTDEDRRTFDGARRLMSALASVIVTVSSTPPGTHPPPHAIARRLRRPA